MWIFLLPEASRICEQLTAKWPLWDDLIQTPAGFQHFLWSSEAAFYFNVCILFWGTERVTHQTRRQLRNSKSNKDTAQNSLESHFNCMTAERCSLYFGDFFFSLSGPRFHLSQTPQCCRTPARQGSIHLMPQCTSGLQQGSQLTCPLLNTHGHSVMTKQTRRSLRDEEGRQGVKTNQHKKGDTLKCQPKGMTTTCRTVTKALMWKLRGFFSLNIYFSNKVLHLAPHG